MFQADIANTGAFTLNVNSLTAKPVVKRGATALIAGDIGPAPYTVMLTYDGTSWEMEGQGAHGLIYSDVVQNANKVLAGPTTGGDAAPTFRTLVSADVPATLSDSGTGTTLTAPREYYHCTGTCTIAIPNGPASGSDNEFCAINDPGVTTAITFSAATSRYYGKPDGSAYGTQTTGTLSCSAGAWNMLCVVSRDANHYVTTRSSGTCTAN